MKIVIQPNDLRAETLGSSRLVSILSSTPLNSVHYPLGSQSLQKTDSPTVK